MKKDPQNQFRVCIRCTTYNHANYIMNTMDGFIKQRTNFPFVCAIIDDASTDGEQNIIKNYLEENFCQSENIAINKETEDYFLEFAQHKTNKNCYFAVFFLKYNHYSIKKITEPYMEVLIDNLTYIALCEGDDFWTYPDKLQIQFDALEAHPECSVASNRVVVVAKDGTTPIGWTIPAKNSFPKESILTLEDYCKEEYMNGRWCFHTSSYLIRNEVFKTSITNRKTIWKDFPYGDMPLLLTCLLNGNIYLFPQKMGCYRYLSGGYSSSIQKDPQKWIKDNSDLVIALKKFDKLTNKKYHKYVKYRICRATLGLAKHGASPVELLLPKYWDIPFGRKNLPGMIFKYYSNKIVSFFKSIFKITQ